MANSQSSKGQRRDRGSIEEDAQVNEIVFNDALRPVFNVPRRTIGKHPVQDPFENCGAINAFTTSWYRSSPAYYRCMNTFKGMMNLDGSICLGATWKLAVVLGRGRDINEILKDKKTYSPYDFDMNYMSKWTGSGDDGICSISKLMDCRNLKDTQVVTGDRCHTILSVDIARSDNDGNCQTVICVLNIIRFSNGRVKEIRLVNLIAISGKLNYTAQTIEIKRAKEQYKAEAIVVDGNGLGKGAIEELLKEQIDPMTGQNLGCYDTLNTDELPEMPHAPKIVFCYLAQSYDQESIPKFMECVETGKLRLLEKKEYSDFDYNSDKKREVMLPYIQTDFLIDEISNIVLKHLNNGKLAIERATTRLDKDRFSALQYGLWYAMKYYDIAEDTKVDNAAYLRQFCNGW